MQGDLLLVVMILIVGCAAFFFGIIYAIYRFFGFMGKCIWSLCTHRPMPRLHAIACRNPHCRHVEQRPATFCSRCGTKILE